MRPFDFGRPDETNGARRPRDLAFTNQFGERARNLQNGHAAACVIVCPWARMVQVTAIGDLLVAQAWVRARDDGGDDVIKSVVASGAYAGAQGDLLGACEARLEGARLF